MRRFLFAIIALVIGPVLVATSAPVRADVTLSASPNPVAPGATLNVTGSGYGRFPTVTLSINIFGVSSQVVTPAGSAGNIYWPFTIPVNTPAGVYTVTASSNSAPIAHYDFIVAGGSITVTPNPVQAGSVLTVTGSGFPAGTSVTVSLPLDLVGGQSTTVQNQTTVSSTGSFAIGLQIPSNTVAKNYTVHVTQSGSTTDLTVAAVTVQSTTYITLSPTTINAGPNAFVTVSGKGYAPNDNVTVSYTGTSTGGGTILEQVTVTADANGDFTITNLPVPGAVVAGTYTVTATGYPSNRTANASLIVKHESVLTVAPTQGPPGTTVIVTGQNFAAVGKVVLSGQIPLNDGTVQQINLAATTAADGSFVLQFVVPGKALPGSVSLSAVQREAQDSINVSASFTVTPLTPALQLSPATVSPGGTFVVLGHGFLAGPGAPVTVNFNALVGGVQQSFVATADTDISGSFALQFTLPRNVDPASISINAVQPASNATQHITLTIIPFTPTPTATPANTATLVPTPTASPTTTPTTVPTLPPGPTVSPTTSPHNAGGVKFKRASIWYHTVRIGTFDQVEVQANHRMKLGIWAHVIFPSGKHYDYYQSTNARGFWSKRFSVPRSALGRHSDIAFVQLQLWRGNRSAKNYLEFTVIR